MRYTWKMLTVVSEASESMEPRHSLTVPQSVQVDEVEDFGCEEAAWVFLQII